MDDPVLRTLCSSIDEVTPGVRALVEDFAENVDMDRRVDLAANQIGVSLCASSWNIEDEIGYIPNPIVVELSDDGFQDDEEGCLLVSDPWFPTKHSLYARAKGTNLDGRKKVVEGEGLMGRCIQHEVDHLDGHSYVDRFNRETRKRAMRAVQDF